MLLRSSLNIDVGTETLYGTCEGQTECPDVLSMSRTQPFHRLTGLPEGMFSRAGDNPQCHNNVIPDF